MPMLQWRPDQVLIITPRGTVIVPRRLYERLEARTPPEDLGLLRHYDWWVQLSELINGIQFLSPTQERKEPQ